MLVMALSSHDGDGATEATLVVARCHRRVMLVMELLMRLGRSAMLISSHDSDGAAESC
jgi:hypothetical protein